MKWALLHYLTGNRLEERHIFAIFAANITARTMKRTPALFVFFFLVTASVATGVRSFHVTRQAIEADLTQALQQTAQSCPSDWLSSDTIRQYRSHLHLADLCDEAYLSLSACEERGSHEEHLGTLSSDSLVVMPSVVARGYVVCSAFSVWKRSDQRLSLLFALLSLFALAFSLHRSHPQRRLIGTSLFYVDTGADAVSGYPFSSLPLTPMQQQFIGLLQQSPGNELPTQAICDALWPGKPDARETLYTLVRRLRPTIESQTPFCVQNIRGRAYRLAGKRSVISR